MTINNLKKTTVHDNPSNPTNKGHLGQSLDFKSSITEASRQIIEGFVIDLHEYNHERTLKIITKLLPQFIDDIVAEEPCSTAHSNAIAIARYALDLLLQRHHARQPIDNPSAFSASIMDSIVNLLVQKNHDYGNSFGNQLARRGNIVFVIRMEDKVSRLRTLLDPVPDASASGPKVKDESIEDTLRDIIGYCILFLHHTKWRNRKKKSKKATN